VSGLSSGGVLAAWLSAYATPGQVSAALFEDPPLFSSEVRPAVGPGIRQTIGPMFDLWSTFLGDQWSIGAWEAMREGAATRLPEHMRGFPVPGEPGQNLKEYDPEWGRSFWTGTVGAACDHERMLQSAKVRSVLLTHHMRVVNADNGFMLGAMSDQQAQRVQDLLTGAGVDVQYRSFPDVGHAMHGEKPDLYVETLFDWVTRIM
jgi:pimeloyl-ACP methyl ester carboxylesterase